MQALPPDTSTAAAASGSADSNGKPRKSLPLTDLEVLKLTGEHPWITPTLCAEQGLFTNKAAASRRLKELCTAGFLSVHPDRQGHYTGGVMLWDMLGAQFNIGRLKVFLHRRELNQLGDMFLQIESHCSEARHELAAISTVINCRTDTVPQETGP